MNEAKPKLLVTIGTLAHMGGAERQALYLVEHLAGLDGCEVEVLTFNDGRALRGQLSALGVKIHVHPYDEHWPRFKRARAIAGLGMRLRKTIRPSALLPFGAPSSKVMGLVKPVSGARFSWWNQQDEGRGLHGTAVEKRLLSRIPALNSNSTAGKEFLARTYGIPEATIAVYNNGTPLPDRAVPSIAWRERLGLGERKIVTMIANLTRFKDHATLIDAWALVRKHRMDSPPALLFAGYLNDAETVSRLKLQAFDLGMSTSDVYLLGPVDDVVGLIGASDLVVHSSLTEGCPNAVCEAMAAGAAVIATDIPGCRQALGDHQGHWLVEPRNPRVLAERIVELLDSDDERARIGIANRERINADFSVEGMNQFFQLQIEAGLGRSLSRSS